MIHYITNINKSLKTKLIFWTILIIILLQLVSSWVLVSSKKKEITEDITKQAQYFVKLTTNHIIQTYLLYHKSGYFKFFELLNGTLDLNEDIKSIYIMKTNGEVLLSPEDFDKRSLSLNNKFVKDINLLEKLKSANMSQNIIIEDGKTYIEFVNPHVDDWGKHFYSVRFIFSFDSLDQKIRLMRNQIIIISLVSILFGIFFILYLSKQITRPLKALLEGVRKITNDNLDHEVINFSHDEIGELSIAFNKMRINLKHSFKQLVTTQEDLKILNLKLEDKVKERTKELAAKNVELERLAITDRLTGLYNRKKLDDTMDSELLRTQRFQNSFGIILLDIDHFKSVNDTYGHQVGDQVLIEVAELLKNNVRTTDIIGRWGGEEFLIICPESNMEGTIKIAEKLRLKIETYEFSIVKSKTCSFGVSIYKEKDDEKSIISRADEALYRAKEHGRNRVEF